MTQPDQDRERRAQKTVARRYRSLGYDVVERPVADRLPNFLQDVTPDIIARSEADNVVIEVKRHASLKGSNDLIDLADRISGHPSWRFELVVLEDRENDQSGSSEIEFNSVMDKVKLAGSVKLFGMAYVYLTTVLIESADEIARRYGVKARHKTDRILLEDLGFRGILPQEVVESSLAALSKRNSVVHISDEMASVSEADVEALARLCERMRQLKQT